MPEEIDRLHQRLLKCEEALKIETSRRLSAEVALQYTDSYTENIYTYANNINTREGGTHLSGLRSALTRTVNNYAKSKN